MNLKNLTVLPTAGVPKEFASPEKDDDSEEQEEGSNQDGTAYSPLGGPKKTEDNSARRRRKQEKAARKEQERRESAITNLLFLKGGDAMLGIAKKHQEVKQQVSGIQNLLQEQLALASSKRGQQSGGSPADVPQRRGGTF